MNSFYGGRQGAPFILSKSYSTIPEMTKDFEQGLSNTDVKFGEYVIINTEDRNHPDNGKVFRRNFIGGTVEWYDGKDANGEYNKKESIEGNGAELIGTIVGPAGPAPHFQLTPYTVEEPVYDEQGNQIGTEEKTYTIEELKNKYNDYKDAIFSEGTLNIDNGSLVPGAYVGEDGKYQYNDEIKWRGYSVRSVEADDTTAFIEMKMPYNVIEFTSQTISPYSKASITRVDDKTHPFYKYLRLNLPKGLHGKSIENVRVIDSADNVVIFDTLNKRLQYDENGKILTKTYPGRDDDITNKRKILACDVIDYDTNPDGDRYVIYLGDYNIINNISLDDKGKFTIDYSHDDNYEVDLQWVKEIKFNEGGTVTIVDINGTERTGPLDGSNPNAYKNLITWIKEWSIDENKNLTIVLNNESAGEATSIIPLRTPNELYTTEDGAFMVKYNTGEPDVFLGRFVYQGNNEDEANTLTPGGLWIETIDIPEV